MKKLLIPSVIFVLGCFLISCNSASTGGMSDKAKKNLETATAIAHMFETNDWSKVGDYIAADGVDHSGMNAEGMPAEVKGLDSIKAEFARMSTMMSDMKNESVKSVADDDYVFQWMTESWTMTKDEMGMKAGSKQTMNAIEVSKFNSDGKVTDHWSFISMGDMMKMMQSSMPQGNMGPVNMPPVDSSKMKAAPKK